MKRILLLLIAILFILIGCNTTQERKSFDDKPELKSDTIRIANDKIEYEVIIIDPGFTSWFNTNAKPKNYYSQSYLEARNRTWVIDPALVDEILTMTTTYELATGAEPSGTEIAFDWMMQLRKVTADNDVIALPYGNPDVQLAKKLAPSELRSYYNFGKERLQLALGRVVRTDPSQNWSVGNSTLNNDLRRNYTENRKEQSPLPPYCLSF